MLPDVLTFSTFLGILDGSSVQSIPHDLHKRNIRKTCDTRAGKLIYLRIYASTLDGVVHRTIHRNQHAYCSENRQSRTAAGGILSTPAVLHGDGNLSKWGPDSKRVSSIRGMFSLLRYPHCIASLLQREFDLCRKLSTQLSSQGFPWSCETPHTFGPPHCALSRKLSSFDRLPSCKSHISPSAGKN